MTSLGGQFWGSDSDVIPQLFVRKIILAQQVDVLPGNHRAVGHRIEKNLPARGMGGLLARSCRNRNDANERESSTKGSTESLGILAQTFGKPAVSTARHGARTLWGRLFGRTRENKHAAGTNVSSKSLQSHLRLEANLNRKANGLALEGPSVGLYVPLLEFSLYGKAGYSSRAQTGVLAKFP